MVSCWNDKKKKRPYQSRCKREEWCLLYHTNTIRLTNVSWIKNCLLSDQPIWCFVGIVETFFIIQFFFAGPRHISTPQSDYREKWSVKNRKCSTRVSACRQCTFEDYMQCNECLLWFGCQIWSEFCFSSFSLHLRFKVFFLTFAYNKYNPSPCCEWRKFFDVISIVYTVQCVIWFKSNMMWIGWIPVNGSQSIPMKNANTLKYLLILLLWCILCAPVFAN